MNKDTLIEYGKKFWNWWRPSAEGSHQTASGRRLSALVITLLCYVLGRIVYIAYVIGASIHAMRTMKDDILIKAIDNSFRWLIYGHIVDVIFIGLLWGFINFQQIVELRTGNKDKDKDKTDDGHSSNVNQQ